MNAVQERAAVAPSTVTRYSRGEITSATRSTRQARRRRERLLAVSGDYAVRIDPRIMQVLHDSGADFRCVEVVSATEVVVHNQRIR